MINKKKKKYNLISLLIIIVALVIMPINIYAATTRPETPMTTGTESLMTIIHNAVGQWYFIFRYFAIAVMLVILIYLGIRLAISSLADDKAKYKRLLFDWLVGFIIIFGIHYFMVLILKLNDEAVKLCQKVAGSIANSILTDEEISLGMMPSTQGLYETVRTRAYELRFSVGTSGMIMYMVLVYYTVRFIIIYFKRFFTVLILTILAPLMGMFYAFNKIGSGKSPILKKWASEYTFNVFLQTFHALIYGCFVQIALAISTQSLTGFLFAMILLNFMMKGEGILRKIFKISGSLIDDNDQKGIKENFAALTTVKAAATGLVGGQMAKDAIAATKRGFGRVADLALRQNMEDNYERDVRDTNGELYDKKQERDKVTADLADETKEMTKEEREALKDKKEKLDSEIARMEEDRNKYRNFVQPRTGPRSEIGKLLGAKGDKKREERIESEYQRRLQYHKDMYGTEYTEDEKKQVRREVEDEVNTEIIRRNVEFNERTNKYEVKNGVAYQLKRDLNTKIWGNNAVKGAVKDMVKTTTTGIRGLGEVMVAFPLVVTEPSVGFALLGKGIKDANTLFGNNEYRKVTTFGERRSIRKVQKKNRKNGKYKFNRFNPHSLKTIEAEFKMSRKLNSIRNINMNRIGNFALTLPLRLTGLTGAMRTLQSKNYAVLEASKDYNLKLETFMTLEKRDSMNKDYIHYYDARVDSIRESIEEKGTAEIVLKHDMDAGKVHRVGNDLYRFNKQSGKKKKPEIITRTELLDNVILKVAAKNKVFDLNDLNLEHEKVQEEVILDLKQLGIIETEASEETIFKQMEVLRERIDIISKNNPSAVEEKLAETVIIDYMERNGIEDEEEIKTEHHRKEIKKEILEIIEKEEERREIITEAIDEAEDESVLDSEIEEKSHEFRKTVSEMEKREKREKREKNLEELISSVEKVDISEEEKKFGEIKDLPEEAQKQIRREIDRQTVVEKTEKIDKELLGLEEIVERINQQRMFDAFENISRSEEQIQEQEEEAERLIQEYIAHNISDKNDILVQNLLAMLEQDKIGIELKFKPEGYERKRITSMNAERRRTTYGRKTF